MKVEYTEWKQETKVIDTDEFWLTKQNDGAIQADKYWHECMEKGEAYCYGRNDIYLNLYYVETGNLYQVYHQTIIPMEMWSIPNKIFSELINFQGK